MPITLVSTFKCLLNELGIAGIRCKTLTFVILKGICILGWHFFPVAYVESQRNKFQAKPIK